MEPKRFDVNSFHLTSGQCRFRVVVDGVVRADSAFDAVAMTSDASFHRVVFTLRSAAKHFSTKDVVRMVIETLYETADDVFKVVSIRLNDEDVLLRPGTVDRSGFIFEQKPLNDAPDVHRRRRRHGSVD